MSIPPPSKRRFRWRHLFVGASIIVLALFVGIPTYFLLATRSHIAAATRGASSIRLEEHLAEEVVAARPLQPAEFQEVIDAIPITATVGIPGVIKFCFVPHHRVVFTDAAQKETTLEICFSCGQLQHSEWALVPVPGAWQERLRQLFLRHDIPIRENYGPVPEP